MIEINFVPAQLRKRKKMHLLGGMGIPLEKVIGLGGGLILLLVFVHVLLMLTNFGKLAQQSKLQHEWESMAPQKKEVDSIIQEMRVLQAKQDSINKILEAKNILWSKKLNIISDVLPRGVWLRKLVLINNTFLIEGSSISKQKREMINVHNLTSNLKDHDSFLDQFSGLELGSISSRNVQKIEIADFLITLKLKGNE